MNRDIKNWMKVNIDLLKNECLRTENIVFKKIIKEIKIVNSK